MATTETRDMISVLTKDHREVEGIFSRLEGLAGGEEYKLRRDLLDEAVIELVRHAIVEEEYLYPTTREVLPDGPALADREISEHQGAEETMNALEGVYADDPRFNQLSGVLMRQIREHITEEERELFPRLAAACSQERLVELGKKIQLAKKIAPTRPHPGAPNRPPLNKLLGPGVALVDRVRDMVSGRGAG